MQKDELVLFLKEGKMDEEKVATKKGWLNKDYCLVDFEKRTR